MSNFLNTIKADLLDRRMLPLVALVALAFVGALAYVVVGGGSSPSTPAAAVPSTRVIAASGVAISSATPEKAVAEMTGGASQQHQGTARNPFTPLPEPKAKAAATATTTASSSTSAAGSAPGSGSSSAGAPPSTGSSPGSGGATPAPSTPATPSKPAAPSKPKTVYHVAVLFGALPAGTTPSTASLTPFENLKLLTPLPTAKQPLIIFRGVTAGGKSATFTLVSEAILHGPAACLPSTTQCEAIDLRESQSEQLEYLSPTGVAELYELRIVSIVSSKASSAAIKSIYRGESKAGRELLGHAGLEAIPDLRYSSQPGVLVFAVHRAFAASHRHGR
jgi:hypothetical protein